MYKVFIDIHILYISSSTKKNNKFEAQIITENDFIAILPTLSSIYPKQVFIVYSENPSKTLNTIFKHHQKVIAAGGIVQQNNNYLFIKRNNLWDVPKG